MSITTRATAVIGNVSGLEAEECEEIAVALVSAGLLAPAPLTEETEVDQIVLFGGRSAVVEARCRWVTDWFPAPDLEDRAEGDGRAQQ